MTRLSNTTLLTSACSAQALQEPDYRCRFRRHYRFHRHLAIRVQYRYHRCCLVQIAPYILVTLH